MFEQGSKYRLAGRWRGDLLLARGTQKAPYTVTLDAPRREKKIERGRDQLACQEPHATRTEIAAGDARRQPGQSVHMPLRFVFLSCTMAGPSNTIQIDGKIRKTIGISIFTGA